MAVVGPVRARERRRLDDLACMLELVVPLGTFGVRLAVIERRRCPCTKPHCTAVWRRIVGEGETCTFDGGCWTVHL